MSRLLRPRPASDPDYWTVKFVDLEGKTRTKVLGRMNKERAQEERILFDAEQVRRARMLRGEVEAPPPESQVRTGRASLDEFLVNGHLHQIDLLDAEERRERLRTLGHMRRLLPDTTLDDLNGPTTQRGYLELRKEEGASWNTRRLEVISWNHLLLDAAARGALSATARAMRNIGPKDSKRFRFLEKDEIGTLRAYLVERETSQAAIRRLRMAVELGLHCGLRPGEITSRRWSDFDLDRGRLRVDHVPQIGFRVKKDQVRSVPLPDELVELLRVYRGWCGPDGHWFLQRNMVGLVWQLSRTARGMSRDRPVTTAEVAAACEELQRYSATEAKWAWYVGSCLNRGTGLLINVARSTWSPNPRWQEAEPVRVGSFYAGLRRAAADAGLRHVWPHALRHSWASLALAEGVPLHIVQAIGGWVTPHVLLDIYAHVHPDRALAAMKEFSIGEVPPGGGA